jgi:hypothetical protein
VAGPVPLARDHHPDRDTYRQPDPPAGYRTDREAGRCHAYRPNGHARSGAAPAAADLGNPQAGEKPGHCAQNSPALGALSGTFSTDLGVLDVIRLVRFGLSQDARKLTGAALDQDVIKPYKTSSGASVLVIKDKASLQQRLAEMFSGKPLSDLGKVTGECPTPPPGFTTNSSGEARRRRGAPRAGGCTSRRRGRSARR